MARHGSSPRRSAKATWCDSACATTASLRRSIESRFRYKHNRKRAPREDRFMLSARNQFQGTIKSVKFGNIMAEIVVDVGSVELVSVITRESAEKMGLKAGMAVTAVIKSTEVMVATEN